MAVCRGKELIQELDRFIGYVADHSDAEAFAGSLALSKRLREVVQDEFEIDMPAAQRKHKRSGEE